MVCTKFWSDMFNLEVGSVSLYLVKCALAPQCEPSPFFYKEPMHYLLSTLSCYCFSSLSDYLLTVPLCFATHASTNIAESPTCNFFWIFLQCSRSLVCHIYVFVTKLPGSCELILLYTPTHTSWLIESALSSHSTLKYFSPWLVNCM